MLDLSPQFRHMHAPVRDYSLGVPVPSDWADKADDDPVFGLWKYCGCWTEEEREILIGCVRQLRGHWLDIGAATGLTTAYLIEAGAAVTAIDPMLNHPEFSQRFMENVGRSGLTYRHYPMTSAEWFEANSHRTIWGAVIDGDHESPHPLNDAKGAYAMLRDTGAILLHDFRGGGIWDAGKYLADQGMKWRVYYTPHMVFLAWRGDFKPPDHTRDPEIDWERERPVPEWVKAA